MRVEVDIFNSVQQERKQRHMSQLSNQTATKWTEIKLRLESFSVQLISLSSVRKPHCCPFQSRPIFMKLSLPVLVTTQDKTFVWQIGTLNYLGQNDLILNIEECRSAQIQTVCPNLQTKCYYSLSYAVNREGCSH